MTASGLCPEICSECKGRLQKAFRLEEAKSPSALLSWNARNQLADARETDNARPVFVPKHDDFGVQVSENPFEAFLK